MEQVRHSTVRHSFFSRTESELSVHEGDAVRVKGILASGWSLCELAFCDHQPSPPLAAVGWVPSAYLFAPEILTELNIQRQFIAAEIVSSEETYFEQLSAVSKLYLEILKKPQCSWLRSADRSIIFRNLEDLESLHSDFYAKLTIRFTHWQAQGDGKFGDLFLELATKLKLYLEYADGYEAATRHLQFVMDEKNKEYHSFQALEMKNRDHRWAGGAGHLVRMLNAPMKRIQAYRSILRQLLRNTYKAHPDYPDLVKALEGVRECAKKVIEEEEATNRRLEVSRIQHLLTNYPNLSQENTQRKFIRQGKLKQIGAIDKEYMWFLFSDILLRASPTTKGWSFKVIDKILLHGLELVDEQDTGGRFPFKIVTPTDTFVVYSKVANEKLGWKLDIVKALHEKIRDEETKGIVKKELKSLTTECACCLVPFEYNMRKMVCQPCGKVVCLMCAPDKHRTPASPGKKVRICSRCFRDIKTPQMQQAERRNQESTKLLRSILNLSVNDEHVAFLVDDYNSKIIVTPPTPATPAPTDFELPETGSLKKMNKDDVPIRSTLSPKPKGETMMESWFWVPHDRLEFVPAKLLFTENGYRIFRTQDGETLTIRPNVEVKEATCFSEGEKRDLINLHIEDCTEAAVLHETRTRYKQDLIYTTLGSILIAVNPCKQLPIYSTSVCQKYARQPAHELHLLPPHVFTIAAQAYASLSINKADQCIVINGESGSGKTETCKLILQLLSEAGSTCSMGETEVGIARIENRLLRTTPVFEAFGNAKTVRNDNSSRFGKWMSIRFVGQDETPETLSFEEILNDEFGDICYGNFAKESFAEENILFIRDVRAFEQLGDQQVRRAVGLQIYEGYIKAKSSMELNLDSFIRVKYDKLIQDENWPPENAFHDVRATIIGLMKTNSWKRFRRSKHWVMFATNLCARYAAAKLSVFRQIMRSGKVITYLLEKTRVTTQAKTERNYHIFYQLCALAAIKTTEDTKDEVEGFAATHAYICKLGLSGDPEAHTYLNQSGCNKLADVDELRAMKLTIQALFQTGFSLLDIQSILRVLAAILLLGNISLLPEKPLFDRFTGKRIVAPPNLDITKVEAFAQCSQIAIDRVKTAMMARELKVGAASTKLQLTPEESLQARDAMAKAMYGNLFDWLTTKMNTLMSEKDTDDFHTIGVLDIFGFECFAVNSLEQLLINYANEKLQYYFNERVFRLEQQEYAQQGLLPSCGTIDFVDNSLCLEFFESHDASQLGVLALINEELAMKKSTDEALLQRITELHQQRSNLLSPKVPGRSIAPLGKVNRVRNGNRHFTRILEAKQDFVVRHYPGDVRYCVTGFLAKSKDKLFPDLELTLQSSTFPLIVELFSNEVREGKTTKRKSLNFFDNIMEQERSKKRVQKQHEATIGTQFQSSLSSLIASLEQSTPHFIRCIKPNERKVAHDFNSHLVLAQMKSAGLEAALRIRRSGFPFRATFSEFYDSFSCCCKDAVMMDESKNEEQLARALLSNLLNENHALDATQFAWGKTKLFWTQSQTSVLGHMKAHALDDLLIISTPPRLTISLSTSRRPSNGSSSSSDDGCKVGGNIDGGSSSSGDESSSSTSSSSSATTGDGSGSSSTSSSSSSSSSGSSSGSGGSSSGSGSESWLPIPQTEALRLALSRPLSDLLVTTQQISDSPLLLRTHSSEVDLSVLIALVSEFTQNLQYFLQLRFHAYPETCGYTVITSGIEYAMVRDEVFCHVIQATQFPDPEVSVRAWKLLYLCLCAFAPTRNVWLAIINHLVQAIHRFSMTHVRASSELLLNNVRSSEHFIRHMRSSSEANLPHLQTWSASLGTLALGTANSKSGSQGSASEAKLESPKSFATAALIAAHCLQQALVLPSGVRDLSLDHLVSLVKLGIEFDTSTELQEGYESEEEAKMKPSTHYMPFFESPARSHPSPNHYGTLPASKSSPSLSPSAPAAARFCNNCGSRAGTCGCVSSSPLPTRSVAVVDPRTQSNLNLPELRL